MSTKAEQIQQQRSSNEQSFQALNDHGSERMSRPSGSSDFDNINDRKMQEGEVEQKIEQKNPELGAKLQILQKLIIENEKSVEEQLQVLKIQCNEHEKEVETLRSDNSNLKKKCNDLEQSLNSHKEELQRSRETIRQQSEVISSLGKLSETKQLGEETGSKDLFKKKAMQLNSLQEQLKQNLLQCDAKINSLTTKLQFFQSQDRKVRQFLLKFLKFNPSFTMQLSTLVESAVIQLDTFLKEINREIQNIILGAHLGHYNKVTARRETLQEEKYNHWNTLSNLDVVKKYVDECYRK